MALCAELQPGMTGNVPVKGGGQPAYVLIPNQLSPEQCTGYLLLDRSDMSALSSWAKWGNLTWQDGSLIALAIGGVWLTAWGIKRLTTMFDFE
ncbi:hypothetical protein GCM10007907_16840 [Chitinimonas prasina]|uniref:Uncharacterized protein n=1 Tax=Chitinimonas prasina TaxID=1434937 RepID=A0ABQ5YDL9_9NEIS|nr:hypothetical protein GCM10007907_16840 [Chitinimonas prasina]